MITLTIKRKDGSTYWTEYFNEQAACDKWIANERTKPYWEKSFSYASVDDSDPAKVAAQKAAQEQLRTDQMARLNAIKAVAGMAPGTLTNDQRDAILIHVVKQALGQ